MTQKEFEQAKKIMDTISEIMENDAFGIDALTIEPTDDITLSVERKGTLMLNIISTEHDSPLCEIINKELADAYHRIHKKVEKYLDDLNKELENI